MVLIISLVLLITIFILSYNNFRKETHKTKEDRVKSMQIFSLAWALVTVTAAAVYCVFSYFINGDPFTFM